MARRSVKTMLSRRSQLWPVPATGGGKRGEADTLVRPNHLGSLEELRRGCQVDKLIILKLPSTYVGCGKAPQTGCDGRAYGLPIRITST